MSQSLHLFRCTVLFPFVDAAREFPADNGFLDAVVGTWKRQGFLPRPFPHITHKLAYATREAFHLVDAIDHCPRSTRPPITFFHRLFRCFGHHFGRHNAFTSPPNGFETDNSVLIHREIYSIHMVVVLTDRGIETVDIDNYRRITTLSIT